MAPSQPRFSHIELAQSHEEESIWKKSCHFLGANDEPTDAGPEPFLLKEVEQRFRKLLFFWMAITASFVRPTEGIGLHSLRICVHTLTLLHTITGSLPNPFVSALRAVRARGGSTWSVVV